MALKNERELYDLKVEFFIREGFAEVDWYEFYRDIFPVGSFEREAYMQDKKPNGLIFVKANDERDRNKVELVFDDLAKIGEYVGQEDVIMSIIGYSGKRRTKKGGYHLYGFTIDLDGQDCLDDKSCEYGFAKFRDTLYQMSTEVIPTATYTVLSGHGLHLYYIFDEPVALKPSCYEDLQKIKDGLTELVWNDFTSMIKPTIERPHVKQFQSFSQGYRVVGSLSKLGKGYPVRAWKTGPRWTLDSLQAFFPKENDIFDKYRTENTKKQTPLEEAKKLWPEWYQKRIVEKKTAGFWIVKRDLYDWWLREIYNKSRQGHRYYGIFTLATYAIKCAIPFEELKRDAYALLESFDSRTLDESNHFTEKDIEAGLKGYRTQAFTHTVNFIEKVSGIGIKRNKRNYKKQKDHLFLARGIRDLKMQLAQKEWRNLNGRPKGSGIKLPIVKAWREAHPEGRKADCIRETGLSKKTVYKYWESSMVKEAEEEV